MNLFDILKHISIDKTKNDTVIYSKEYNKFMINKYLSMNNDTIFYANEMNKRNLNNEMHYDFLFHSLNKKYRFFKYIKRNKDKLLSEISNKFNVSLNKAKDYMKIIIKKKIKI